jgi:7,8-dihydropterin-6-yl-methyl-4-(beta-D-ribofuranosyl)aminobenzene 5'-phosphate synthase
MSKEKAWSFSARESLIFSFFRPNTSCSRPSCSHAGICNVVLDAITTFNRPVYMIIAGLHLAPPEAAHRIPLTVDFLYRRVQPRPKFVLPVHCTGFDGKIALEKAFGKDCVPAGVGMKVDVIGDEEAERTIGRGAVIA